MIMDSNEEKGKINEKQKTTNEHMFNTNILDTTDVKSIIF